MVGANLNLMVYRAAVLRSAGLESAVCSPAEMERLLAAGQKFKVVIFCTTLEIEVRARLAALIRQRSPAAKLLLLGRNAPSKAEAALFDKTMIALDGPSTLIRTVRDMVGE